VAIAAAIRSAKRLLRLPTPGSTLAPRTEPAGLAVGDALGEAEGVGVARVWEPSTEGELDGVGVGVVVVVGEGVGVVTASDCTSGMTDGDGVALGVGVALAVGLGVVSTSGSTTTSALDMAAAVNGTRDNENTVATPANLRRTCMAVNSSVACTIPVMVVRLKAA
jgi:hypothetical protein